MSVIYDDITQVVAPDPRPNSGYSTGESAWVVVTKNGRLLSVTTRRIPRHLRWSNERLRKYFA